MTKLFVVPKQEIQSPIEPEEVESDLLEVSGDTAADLETAIRALAFLVDWIENVGGAEGLRICADGVRRFREEEKE